ncbi:hypothetical protein EV182_005639, partial [Spiromyces aspiralis]
QPQDKPERRDEGASLKSKQNLRVAAVAATNVTPKSEAESASTINPALHAKDEEPPPQSQVYRGDSRYPGGEPRNFRRRPNGQQINVVENLAAGFNPRAHGHHPEDDRFRRRFPAAEGRRGQAHPSYRREQPGRGIAGDHSDGPANLQTEGRLWNRQTLGEPRARVSIIKRRERVEDSVGRRDNTGAQHNAGQESRSHSSRAISQDYLNPERDTPDMPTPDRLTGQPFPSFRDGRVTILTRVTKDSPDADKDARIAPSSDRDMARPDDVSAPRDNTPNDRRQHAVCGASTEFNIDHPATSEPNGNGPGKGPEKRVQFDRQRPRRNSHNSTRIAPLGGDGPRNGRRSGVGRGNSPSNRSGNINARRPVSPDSALSWRRRDPVPKATLREETTLQIKAEESAPTQSIAPSTGGDHAAEAANYDTPTSFSGDRVG